MGKLYRDEVSGVVTDEYGNPVNANQSFGSNPDSAQGAAVNGGLLSYLMGKGREAINNPEAPWNAQSGLLAVADTAALPAKAIGQGLLALPDRIQSVTGAAQRGDYGPATDDAMSVAFSGLPVGAATAPAGVAGMFAGKMAKTANLDKLAQAERMAASGASRDSIWGETGWFKAPDGNWKWEINDSGVPMKMRLDEKALFSYPEVPSVMPHQDLFKAYPDLSIHRMTPDFENGGHYDSAQKTVGARPIADGDFTPAASQKMKSTILHELQHGVQDAEGFGRGGSPGDFSPAATNDAHETFTRLNSALRSDTAKKLRAAEGDFKQIMSIRKADPTGYAATNEALTALGGGGFSSADSALADLASKINRAPTPHEQYSALAGEAEARAVQARMNLTPEQRAARPPWQDYDVPEDKQIVRFGK